MTQDHHAQHAAAHDQSHHIHWRDVAQHAANAVRARVGDAWVPPACAIVLGSGLGGLAQRVTNAVRIPFADIPGFPTATVVGHAGELIVGTLREVPVVMLAGRLHLYEGHDPALAALPVRVLHALGAPVYLASNAAGGINRAFSPGDVMLITDHLNLMARNPLIGPLVSGDTRFPDMTAAYDPELQQQLRNAAIATQLTLREGVYAAVLGPSFETPAEVRMLGLLGADAVGMSTVPEVIVARVLGMRVAALSLITNVAAGLSGDTLNHEEVLHVGREAADRVEQLVSTFVERLHGAS
jgi:purine-nucleoside phosphorylase